MERLASKATFALFFKMYHHVAAGHGPPNIFKTLSCAEYFWTGVIRLLEERIWTSEGKRFTEEGDKAYGNGKKVDLSADKTARNKAVNDYSIVVQEFFIKRVEDWLETVGRRVLAIECYWARIEFAKGRGQIHVHLLAILRKDIMDKLHQRLDKNGISRDEEAEIMSEWASDQFGMTASIDESISLSTDADTPW